MAEKVVRYVRCPVKVCDLGGNRPDLAIHIVFGKKKKDPEVRRD